MSRASSEPVVPRALPAAGAVDSAIPTRWQAFGARAAWQVTSLVALGYAALAAAGVMVGSRVWFNASLLFPAAGLALAAALVGGRAALWGVFIGASVFQFGYALSSPAPVGVATVLISLVLACGATVQAWVGRTLVQRQVSQPLVLSEPIDLTLFYLYGGAVAGLLSASVGVSMLVATGTVQPTEWASTWLTWWAGDMLGVAIAAPMVLTLIGEPRAEWAPRWRTLGLPMGVALVLMALGTLQLSRLNEERQQDAFTREASFAAGLVDARLQAPLRALEAANSAFLASPNVSRDGFRRAVSAWLRDDSELQSLAWAEAVPRDRLPEFEAALRTEGLAGAQARPARAGSVPAGEPALMLRYIEPQALNALVLGTDLASLPMVREAIVRAVRQGRAIATPVFALPQGGVGTMIMRPVFDGEPATVGAREQALRGVLVATVRPGNLWMALRQGLPARMAACLVDEEPTKASRLLAGDPGCVEGPAAASGWRHVHTTDFGGRRWQLQISAQTSSALAGAGSNTRAFSVVGLLATALFGALLLTVTGRSQRIERAVADRTADLTREIAVRAQAEAALGESEKRFRVIFDSAPVGMVYADMSGRIRQTNPAFVQLTGYGRDELMQITLDDLTHPDDRAPDERMLARLASGEVRHAQRSKRYVRKEGESRWVRVHLRSMDEVGGKPTRMVGVVEDITEHLRLQDAERARERAEDANRAKSEFLSRMSHELRTPLNAMLGFAQLLELDRDQPLAAHQASWTQQIQHAGWHLLSMINDTLDLSRIESGNLKLQPEPIDVTDVLNATSALVTQESQRRAITIELMPPVRPISVEGDLTRVKQILTNLLSNAVKYNIDGGMVRMTGRLRDAHTVEIEVADTGLGMTPAQLAELFQPFNRLGREGSEQEGTGIGLVISQRLAQLMGGSLDVRSAAGEGSIFTLVLPRASSGTGLTDLGGLDEAAPAFYHRRRVHYIEDNATNAEVMRGIVSQRPQVQLDISTTGLGGLAAVRRDLPDLVMLDMHLPDVDGLEVLRELAMSPATANIPVLVVSADASVGRHEAALAAGAAQYLTKPVGVAQMLAALDRELERLETRYD